MRVFSIKNPEMNSPSEQPCAVSRVHKNGCMQAARPAVTVWAGHQSNLADLWGVKQRRNLGWLWRRSYVTRSMWRQKALLNAFAYKLFLQMSMTVHVCESRMREEKGAKKPTKTPEALLCLCVRVMTLQRVCFELKWGVADISHRSMVLCKMDLWLWREVFII